MPLPDIQGISRPGWLMFRIWLLFPLAAIAGHKSVPKVDMGGALPVSASAPITLPGADATQVSPLFLTSQAGQECAWKVIDVEGRMGHTFFRSASCPDEVIFTPERVFWHVGLEIWAVPWPAAGAAPTRLPDPPAALEKMWVDGTSRRLRGAWTELAKVTPENGILVFKAGTRKWATGAANGSVRYFVRNGTVSPADPGEGGREILLPPWGQDRAAWTAELWNGVWNTLGGLPTRCGSTETPCLSVAMDGEQPAADTVAVNGLRHACRDEMDCGVATFPGKERLVKLFPKGATIGWMPTGESRGVAFTLGPGGATSGPAYYCEQACQVPMKWLEPGTQFILDAQGGYVLFNSPEEETVRVFHEGEPTAVYEFAGAGLAAWVMGL